MTNILAIPLVQITATVGSDEDWIDAISFTDSNNVPIDLTGITITLCLFCDLFLVYQYHDAMSLRLLLLRL